MLSLSKMTDMLLYSVASTVICCIFVVIYALFWKDGKKLRLEDILFMAMLIVVTSLRYEVGSDYLRYLGSYQFAARRFADLSTLFSRETLTRYSFEIGYEFVSVLTSRLFSSKYAILWIISIILYIPIIVYCRKHTCNSKIAVGVFFLYGFWGLSLNVLKQAVAMMLVLYVQEALENKKYLRAVILSVIATSFHTTALLVCVILFIIHFGLLKKIVSPTRQHLFLLIAIGIVLRFSTGIILRILNRTELYTQYLSYLTAGTEDRISRSFIWIGALIETVIVCVILYIAINKLKKIENRDPRLEKIISIVMLGVPFSIIGISKTLWLSNRFAKYFFVFLIALMPMLLNTEELQDRFRKPSNSRTVFWISFIIWHAVYAVLLLDNNTFHIGTYLFM